MNLQRQDRLDRLKTAPIFSGQLETGDGENVVSAIWVTFDETIPDEIKVK